MHYSRSLCLILLLSLVSGLPTQATTLEFIPLGQLTQTAQLILDAEIGSSRVAAIHGNPFTLVDVVIRETLQGTTTNPVTVAIPGGELINAPVPIQVEVPGAPRLFPGSHAILFLEEVPGAPGLYQLVGLSQGVFYLSEDGSTARQDLRGAHLVSPTMTGGASTGGPDAWSRDALVAQIRAARPEVAR